MGPAAAPRADQRPGPDDAKVSFNDLVIKAAALALREFPNLNTSLEGDQLVDPRISTSTSRSPSRAG